MIDPPVADHCFCIEDDNFSQNVIIEDIYSTFEIEYRLVLTYSHKYNKFNLYYFLCTDDLYFEQEADIIVEFKKPLSLVLAQMALPYYAFTEKDYGY